MSPFRRRLCARRLVFHRCLGAIAAAIAVVVLGGVSEARASQLIDRNVQDVKLEVNAKGEAMLTYEKGGVLRHVLAWGAVNAMVPSADAAQVAFKLDYSGGYGRYRKLQYWQAPGWVCRPYNGPALAWQVAACRAPDGSFWAVQAWQRALPDLGETATVQQDAWELHLSHWTGALPVLTITLDWSYRRFDHLFGSLTYDGTGVYGFRSTSSGLPLDSFGRNIYLDTFDSSYGSGWRRENSFLTHGPNGSFCYGFYPHGSRPSGKGSEYRATVIGPGVTPDVTWQGTAPGLYNAELDAAAQIQEKQLGDPRCNA
jgi:hypothetical protein